MIRLLCRLGVHLGLVATRREARCLCCRASWFRADGCWQREA